MKVTDVSKAPRSQKIGKTKAGAGETSAHAAAVDAVVIAGIPENELTPRVREVLQSLMSEVQALRTELAATRARVGELEHLADTDPLLGVLNRRAFVRELNRALATVERYETPASLLFADLDDLKVINDKFGHGAGDAALLHVAKIIGTHIRQTDSIGRLGGDEFGVILAQSDFETAKEKGRALAALVASEDVEWGGRAFPARVSCGAVEIKGGLTADEAIASADSAMYDAKSNR